MSKAKAVIGGYILISLGMVDISALNPNLEIDFSRLTETHKLIRLCNINIGGVRKPNIDIKPEFSTNKITLSDVYGYDLVVSSDNSVEVKAHRSEYELPVPQESDAGKSVVVDSEGKYSLLKLLDGLNIDDLPTIADINNPTQEELANCFGKAFKVELNDSIHIFIPSIDPLESSPCVVYTNLRAWDDGFEYIEINVIEIVQDSNNDYSLQSYRYLFGDSVTTLYEHGFVDHDGNGFSVIDNSESPITKSNLFDRLNNAVTRKIGVGDLECDIIAIDVTGHTVVHVEYDNGYVITSTVINIVDDFSESDSVTKL